MPFIAVIVPSIPEEAKDQFLAAWPTIAAEMKAQPMVLGVSGGPIVAEDGKAVTGFKFIQTLAFATLEDAEGFKNSEWAKEAKSKAEARGMPEPHNALFEVAEFPKDRKPLPFTQFSRIIVKDDAALQSAQGAWKELCSVLGKESVSGTSVGDGPKTSMDIMGWDSLEEAGAKMAAPEVREAFAKHHQFGDCKDIMAQLSVD